MSDIKDILACVRPVDGVPQKRSRSLRKKPKNMSRELFALIGNQGLACLAPSAKVQSGRYKKKRTDGKVRWKWASFKNSARENDDLLLQHWVRGDMEYPDYPFAKFNKKIDAWARYTEEEYAKHLSGMHATAVGGPWTRLETDRLFDLCKKYDVRWNVVVDRFSMTAEEAVARVHGLPAPSAPRTQRPLYALKERFYGVLKAVHLARGQQEEANRYVYDAVHEARRAHQTHVAYVRPLADEKEEKRLEAELKTINVQLNRLEKAAKTKRRGEWRDAGGVGCPPMLPLGDGYMEGPLLLLPPLCLQKRNYMRSDRLLLRAGASGPGPRLKKKMALVIAELGVPSRLMPTEVVCAAYDKLRQDVLKVLALQKYATRLQAELRSGCRRKGPQCANGGNGVKAAKGRVRSGKSFEMPGKGHRQKRKAHGAAESANKRNRPR